MYAASEEAAQHLEESGDRIGPRYFGIRFEDPFLNPMCKREHRCKWIIRTTEVARMFFDQGIGHSAGDYREGTPTVGLGFRKLTYFFNATPPLDHMNPSILDGFM